MASSLESQLQKIAKRINLEAKISLNTNVADKIIEQGKINVQTIVYDVYEPFDYNRTHDLKERAWKVNSTKSGVSIRTDRTDGGKQVSMIVESGYGYTIPDRNTPLQYGMPRPFMEKTREYAVGSGIVEEILAKDLSKELGLRVIIR